MDASGGGFRARDCLKGKWRGGLCWLRGAAIIYVDTTLSTVERVVVLAEALSGLDLDHVSMVPAARERIEAAARRRREQRTIVRRRVLRRMV
jgi:hypothetical protein